MTDKTPMDKTAKINYIRRYCDTITKDTQLRLADFIINERKCGVDIQQTGGSDTVLFIKITDLSDGNVDDLYKIIYEDICALNQKKG